MIENKMIIVIAVILIIFIGIIIFLINLERKIKKMEDEQKNKTE
jgi:preprotein translocase subunit SecG